MNIVTKLLTYQNQVKILHWQTTSYSEHKSLGDLYDGLSGHIDQFVEVFMGKYGRIVSPSTFNLILENYTLPHKNINYYLNMLRQTFYFKCKCTV